MAIVGLPSMQIDIPNPQTPIGFVWDLVWKKRVAEGHTITSFLPIEMMVLLGNVLRSPARGLMIGVDEGE